MGNLTISEFTQKFKIGVTKTYEEINAGRLKAIKLGKRTLIPVRAAEEWQDALPAVKAGKAA